MTVVIVIIIIIEFDHPIFWMGGRNCYYSESNRYFHSINNWLYVGCVCRSVYVRV